MNQNGGLKKKDDEGPCQIRVAPGLGPVALRKHPLISPFEHNTHTRIGRKPLTRTSREPLTWRLLHLYILSPPLANLSRPAPEVGVRESVLERSRTFLHLRFTAKFKS
jgi:hypothetical protein